MVSLINLTVGTFTVLCMLVTFGLSWMVTGAIGVPQVGAFFVSLIYSLIPVILFIREETAKPMEKRNEHRITPSIVDDGGSTPAAFTSQPSKRKRGRAGNSKAKPVQSGGDGTSNKAAGNN